MAEEQEFQSPEGHGHGHGHRLCANNCGFSATPATLNLCSKCYRDHQMKENQAKSAKSAVENSLLIASSSSSSSSPVPAAAQNIDPVVAMAVVSAVKDVRAAAAAAAVTMSGGGSTTNRCCACRKRVGLTGFGCRCGSSFCGVHRYPERHNCTFDYKSAGRFAIAKENPLVKADKLDKI